MTIMSRRKQSNPKPLLKRDDEDFPSTTEETSSTAVSSGGDTGVGDASPTLVTNDGDETNSELGQSESPSPSTSPNDIKSLSRCSSPQLSPTISNDRTSSSNGGGGSNGGNNLINKETNESRTNNNNNNNNSNKENDKLIIMPPIPKLRLNLTLASDPALQPEAKVIKEYRITNDDDNLLVDKMETEDFDVDDEPKERDKERLRHKNIKHQHTRISVNNNVSNNEITQSSASGNLPRMQAYICGPCGIRFSSPSTLEAHQNFYCSHRKENIDDGNTVGGNKTNQSTTGGTTTTSSTDTAGGGEPPSKSIRTGKQYACTQCSYSADKKVSLNRHMRMHQTSPAPSSTTSNGDDATSQIQHIDRYCSDCDIRFSSTKTYRAHKQHYCSSRHRDGQNNNTNNNTNNNNNNNSSLTVNNNNNNNSNNNSNTTPNNIHNATNNNNNNNNNTINCNNNLQKIIIKSGVKHTSIDGELSSTVLSLTPQVKQSTIVANATINTGQTISTTTATGTIPQTTQLSSIIAKTSTTPPITSSLSPITASTIAATTNHNSSINKTKGNLLKTNQQVFPQQSFIALKTNPIIILPYSLITNYSVLPGPLTITPSVSNPDTTCFILQNDALLPIAHTIQTTHGQHVTTSGYVANNQVSSRVQTPTSTPSTESSIGDHATENFKVANRVTRSTVHSTSAPLTPTVTTTPLDLSVRRLVSPHHTVGQRERSLSLSSSMQCSLNELRHHNNNSIDGLVVSIGDTKENISLGSNDSLTPEQIICAPSLPGSPPLTPSPKRRSNSPRNFCAISTTQAAIAAHHQQQQQQQALLRPLLSADLALRLTEPSQVLVKQGVELALRLSSAAVVNSIADCSSQSQIVSSASANRPQVAVSPLLQSGVTPPSLPPQIFVKQGVSKCKECNIVFCKYENYLAHKKHYCSARNLDDTDAAAPGSAGNGSGTSGGSVGKGSPPISPQSTSPSSIVGNIQGPISGAPPAYQQLICAACGIKFTNLDNLSAHQAYYCPKRVDLGMQQQIQNKERCQKCKTIHEIGQPCPVVVITGTSSANTIVNANNNSGSGSSSNNANNSNNTYKCPICEVVSSSAAESRRHMDTHGGVKAFRCSICRYKGNTLRGMRTHIRMHFDKKSNDFNEENYITCIREEDGIEIPPAAAVAAAQAAAVAAAAAATAAASIADHQVHSCDLCNYSSTYKGNVVRHIKLVHTQTMPIACSSPILGEGGENLLHNGDISGKRSLSVGISVKMEPCDDVLMGNLNNNMDVTDGPGGNDDNEVYMGDDGDCDADNSEINVDEHHQHQQHRQKQIKIEVNDICERGTPKQTASPATSLKNDITATVTEDGPKYCKQCDIKFNYMDTFIAHKKFYCKNKPDLSNVPLIDDIIVVGPISPTITTPTTSSAVTTNKRIAEATLL